jgi:hypothetical protein
MPQRRAARQFSRLDALARGSAGPVAAAHRLFFSGESERLQTVRLEFYENTSGLCLKSKRY